MQSNPLTRLDKLGQSVWLDYIRRDMFQSGTLQRLIEQDGLRGVTTNPAILKKAIVDSHVYDADIGLMSQEGLGPEAMYERLCRIDVQSGADQFRALYEMTGGRDGYVSLEVNPHLAHHSGQTIDEGRRLWKAVNRPNVFIKIPATLEGLPAIQQLVADGINVNVTLLFGVQRYRQVADAYIAGIESRVARGKDIKRIASVASFFLSRIDTMVDPILDEVIIGGAGNAQIARQSLGQVAVASARMAYWNYKAVFGSSRFKALAQKGASVQRLLWASTGTKNPAYSDVKYVDSLVGADTVNTMPVETLNAYRDHGVPESRLEHGIENAAEVLRGLPQLGVNMTVVAQQLEDEGVEKFERAYDALLAALAHRQPPPELAHAVAGEALTHG